MKHLTIYFTSDTHGYLFPTDFTAEGEKPMGLYNMRFPRDGDTLVIDGGDTIQGSPLTYFCRTEGLPCPAAAAMNERGYDYVTLGNHDFNYGKAWLSSHLTELNAVCLCANVKDRTGALPIVPWTVRKMQSGLSVGLFGIVTPWIKRWENPDNLTDFDITDPLEAARRAVRALQAAGAEQIVCVYHGGLEKDPETGRLLSDTDENIACRIAEALPIDLMLTGHQHIPMENVTWAGTHIVQPPCNARAYVHLAWDEENGWRSRLCPVTESLPRTQAEQVLWERLNRFLSRRVGTLPFPFLPGDKLEMALRGSDIADFFNEVELWASGADIACCSLANEVRGFSSQVTVRDVVASYPYANTLTVMEIDGRILRLALEQCARYFERAQDGTVTVSPEFLTPKVAHYNYDYFAGLRYAFDLARPMGDRVVKMERNGRPIGPDDRLTLCMCNYRATGAGHFDFYTRLKVIREIQTDMSELILDYLRSGQPIRTDGTHPFVCLNGEAKEG